MLATVTKLIHGTK